MMKKFLPWALGVALALNFQSVDAREFSNVNPNRRSYDNGAYRHGADKYSNQYSYKSGYAPRYRKIISIPRPVVVVPRPSVKIYLPAPRVKYNLPQEEYRYGFNFKDLLQTIQMKAFESDKVSIARQALVNNRFDTYQIRELLSLFSFEDSRLEIAKAAYNRCVDPQNYYKINEVFQFSSSIRELEDFMLTRR